MISALCWVPRGAFAPPDAGGGTDEEAELSGSELDEASEPEGTEEQQQVAQAAAFAAALKSGSDPQGASRARAASAAAAAASAAGAGPLAALRLDRYDEEEVGASLFASGRPGLAYHAHPGEDPYLALGEPDSEEDEEEEEAGAGPGALRPTDLVVLAAKSEDDVNSLEVWVYEEAAGEGDEANLFVHHALLLPNFPLAVAWLDCGPGGRDATSLAAVGSMSPGIELWRLGAADAVEPLATLGAPQEKKSTKKGKVKRSSRKLRDGSHAVLGLAPNPEFRNVLASACADHTVTVWDVAAGAAAHRLGHHEGKVQAVAWSPGQPHVLLSGGFDRRACLVDVRQPGRVAATWALGSDVEALCWDPAAPATFLVSGEDGLVAAFDARAGPPPAPAGGAAAQPAPGLFRLAAHDKPTSALDFCPAAPGLLLTASTDKQVKLWDVGGGAPALVAAQGLGVGAVFAAGFAPGRPHLAAAAGSKGAVAVWDVTSAPGVAAKYGRQLGAAAAAAAVAAAEGSDGERGGGEAMQEESD